MDIGNIRKKFITTYKQINDKLQEATKVYLEKGSDNPRSFITRQKRANHLGITNDLIEAPKGDIYKIIEEQYQIKNAKDEPIGTLSPEEQKEGIKKMALLMLMANRASKAYKELLINNKNLNEKQAEMYKKKEREFLVVKDQATSDLLANLYVLGKEKDEKNADYFYYGLHKDEFGKDTLVMDIPEYGQISVHFGRMKQIILEDAKEKASSILEVKKDKGQINQEQLELYTKQISNNHMLPKYEENLYEVSSALPLKYVDDNITNLTKKIRIYKKDPSTFDNKDMSRMIKEGLNVREARYMCLKLGCPKKQLQEVSKVYSERNMIKQSLKETNAEERQSVRQHQQRNLQKYRENNYKSRGGR